MLSRAEWSPINRDEITKLAQRIAFNEKKTGSIHYECFKNNLIDLT